MVVVVELDRRSFFNGPDPVIPPAPALSSCWLQFTASLSLFLSHIPSYIQWDLQKRRSLIKLSSNRSAPHIPSPCRSKNASDRRTLCSYSASLRVLP
jgi:hypothetical protein